MGSILGGILGGGSSPGQAQQEAALRNATEAYKQYRPEAMQARLNAMGTISNAYQGANNALETMWGAPPAAPNGLSNFRHQPSGRGLQKADRPEGDTIYYADYTGPTPDAHDRPRPTGGGNDMLGQVFDPLNIFGGW